jgi:chaperonin GroES
MTIRPLRDRILIKRDERETITSGGIVLPDGSQRDRPQKGTVLAKGPGVAHHVPLNPQPVFDPIHFEIGDEVIFTKYAGEGIRLAGDEYFLAKVEDIIAVIEPDGAEASDLLGVDILHIDEVA